MKRTHLAIALALASSACQRAGTPAATSTSTTTATAAQTPHVVTIVAHEYALQLPDTIPAGPTAFVLRNDGHQPHEASFALLDSGKTAADYLAVYDGPDPVWAHSLGGPGLTFPGGGHDSVTTTLVLAPGHYAVSCGVPGPDGKAHARSGMIKDLIVTSAASQGSAPSPPASDVSITLVDYAFQFSAPLTAGIHTVAVTDQGKHGHHMVMVRLAPGKTVSDFLAWAEKPTSGPSPALWSSGAAYMTPGATNYVTANFAPGTYAVVCFIPDENGKPHFTRGMQKQFTIT